MTEPTKLSRAGRGGLLTDEEWAGIVARSVNPDTTSEQLRADVDALVFECDRLASVAIAYKQIAKELLDAQGRQQAAMAEARQLIEEEKDDR